MSARTDELLDLTRQVIALEAQRDRLIAAIREHNEGLMSDCYFIEEATR